MKFFAFIPLAYPLLVLPGHSQEVLVVSQSVGSVYSTVDAALAAASPNAIILVRNGVYPGFTVDGQAVAVTNDLQADAFGTAVFNSPVSVRNVGLGQSVTLNGLACTSPDPLLVEDCAGSVLVQGCSLQAHAGGGTRVKNSGSVTFIQSALEGGTSSYPDDCFPACQGLAPGTPGLRVEQSNVQVYDAQIKGGRAGDAESEPGTGLEIVDADVLLTGTTVRGALGTQGSPPSPFGPCTNGGDGGDAVRMISGDPSLRAFDSVIAPGPGGELAQAPCLEGLAGTDVVVDAGTASIQPGPTRRFTAASPVQGGEAFDETYVGPAGSLVFLAFSSTNIASTSVAGLDVPLHLGPEFGVLSRGVLGSDGTLVESTPFAGFGPGVDGLTIYAQPVFVDGGTLSADLVPLRAVQFLAAGF